jgi:hypothetical protein
VLLFRAHKIRSLREDWIATPGDEYAVWSGRLYAKLFLETVKMNHLLRIAPMLLSLSFLADVHAQKITVVAVSHVTTESDYTTSTPGTANTNCSVYSTSVNCNTTSYGGNTRTNAVYRLNQVVNVREGDKVTQYTLTRTARWRWSSTDFLREGDSFPAEVKGKHMFITCHKGGNQGKKETLKYEILDIRPAQ